MKRVRKWNYSLILYIVIVICASLLFAACGDVAQESPEKSPSEESKEISYFTITSEDFLNTFVAELNKIYGEDYFRWYDSVGPIIGDAATVYTLIPGAEDETFNREYVYGMFFYNELNTMDKLDERGQYNKIVLDHTGHMTTTGDSDTFFELFETMKQVLIDLTLPDNYSGDSNSILNALQANEPFDAGDVQYVISVNTTDKGSISATQK